MTSHNQYFPKKYQSEEAVQWSVHCTLLDKMWVSFWVSQHVFILFLHLVAFKGLKQSDNMFSKQNRKQEKKGSGKRNGGITVAQGDYNSAFRAFRSKHGLKNSKNVISNNSGVMGDQSRVGENIK